NTVIIMTSNLGSEYIQEADDKQEVEGKVNAALQSNFRPEFINRIDEKIIFNSLSREDLTDIVDIQLDYLRENLADRKLSLEITDKARENLMQLGYDPAYGARPLRRAIQKHIKDELAMELLEGKIEEGDKVLIDWQEEEFKFIPRN
ncbi:MAG: AAA family ATPase, partial [Halanaerobiales bacterium]